MRGREKREVEEGKRRKERLVENGRGEGKADVDYEREEQKGGCEGRSKRGEVGL